MSNLIDIFWQILFFVFSALFFICSYYLLKKYYDKKIEFSQLKQYTYEDYKKLLERLQTIKKEVFRKGNFRFLPYDKYFKLFMIDVIIPFANTPLVHKLIIYVKNAKIISDLYKWAFFTQKDQILCDPRILTTRIKELENKSKNSSFSPQEYEELEILLQIMEWSIK